MWNQTALNALDDWLGPDTGLKHHPIEDCHFHAFVLAVWDEHGSWDEQYAGETITQRAKELHPGVNEKDLRQSIKRRLAAGLCIVDFLSNVKQTTGRHL